MLRQVDRDSDFLVHLDGKLQVRRCCQSCDGVEEMDDGAVFPGQTVVNNALGGTNARHTNLQHNVLFH